MTPSTTVEPVYDDGYVVQTYILCCNISDIGYINGNNSNNRSNFKLPLGVINNKPRLLIAFYLSESSCLRPTVSMFIWCLIGFSIIHYYWLQFC